MGRPRTSTLPYRRCETTGLHGTTGYKRGCRCQLCTLALLEYQRHRIRASAESRNHRRRTRIGLPHTSSTDNSTAVARARKRLYKEIKRGDIHRPEACSGCGDRPGRGHRGQSLIFAIFDPSDPIAPEWLCSLCAGAKRWTR